MPHYETKWQNLNQSGYFPVQGKLEDSVLGDFTEWDMGFDSMHRRRSLTHRAGGYS